MEVLQVFRDVLASGALMVGTTIGVLGYRAWHRQILGKTEHDAARNLLLSGLRVREEVRDIRSALPYLPSGDQAAKQRGVQTNEPWLTEWRKRRRKEWEEQFEGRLKRLGDRVVDLQVAVLEAEALWGAEAKVPIGPLVEIARELQAGVWDYFWVNRLFEPEEFPEPSLETWATIGIGRPSSRTAPDAKDVFGERVDAAVSDLERYYRPKLQLRGR